MNVISKMFAVLVLTSCRVVADAEIFEAIEQPVDIPKFAIVSDYVKIPEEEESVTIYFYKKGKKIFSQPSAPLEKVYADEKKRAKELENGRGHEQPFLGAVDLYLVGNEGAWYLVAFEKTKLRVAVTKLKMVGSLVIESEKGVISGDPALINWVKESLAGRKISRIKSEPRVGLEPKK